MGLNGHFVLLKTVKSWFFQIFSFSKTHLTVTMALGSTSCPFMSSKSIFEDANNILPGMPSVLSYIFCSQYSFDSPTQFAFPHSLMHLSA